MKKLILVFGISICLVNGIFAQTAGTTTSNMGTMANYGASYTIPSSTGVNMAVNIWGMVSRPGQYMIPYSIDIDIVSLLSLAGGPKKGARLSAVILLRETGDSSEPEMMIVDINKFMETGDRTLLPTIEPNDTIILQETVWSKMTNNTSMLQIASSAMVILYYIDRLMSESN